MAEKIRARGPVAVRQAKRAINRGLEGSLDKGLDIEAWLWAELTDTKDMQEGVTAFLEKRKPKFKGE
jgi:enoyl-CoA hydratase/carnithine racemase